MEAESKDERTGDRCPRNVGIVVREARTLDREGALGSLGDALKAWDDVTGRELDPNLVRRARQEEI